MKHRNNRASTIPSFADSHYSVAHDNVFNVENRLRVARQIEATLNVFLKGKNLKKLRFLDIGSSTGIITQYVAQSFSSSVGIDIDPFAVARAQKTYGNKRVRFEVASAISLPFTTNSFDVIICNETLTYVDNQEKTLSEIYRILRPGGVCFLTVDNQLFPIESQYHLPLLHWLPSKIAQAWLRSLNHKNFYLAHYLTYWQLYRLCDRFIIYDFTPRILKNPIRYRFVRIYKYARIFKHLPQGFLEIMKLFVPTFIFLLVKPYGEISRKPNTRRRGEFNRHESLAVSTRINLAATAGRK